MFNDPSTDSGFDPYTLVDESWDWSYSLSFDRRPSGVVAYPTG